MYSVPVLYTNDNQKIIGSVSLNQEIESLLKEGVSFILDALVVERDYNLGKVVVGVSLTPVPTKDKNDE